eukprot:CCRYP_007754-RH/>CCRYP_007754-RH protein AED:0.47 eAED:0.73 QI:0/0/0/1/0/0/2/0/152
MIAVIDKTGTPVTDSGCANFTHQDIMKVYITIGNTSFSMDMLKGCCHVPHNAQNGFSIQIDCIIEYFPAYTMPDAPFPNTSDSVNDTEDFKISFSFVWGQCAIGLPANDIQANLGRVTNSFGSSVVISLFASRTNSRFLHPSSSEGMDDSLL